MASTTNIIVSPRSEDRIIHCYTNGTLKLNYDYEYKISTTLASYTYISRLFPLLKVNTSTVWGCDNYSSFGITFGEDEKGIFIKMPYQYVGGFLITNIVFPVFCAYGTDVICGVDFCFYNGSGWSKHGNPIHLDHHQMNNSLHTGTGVATCSRMLTRTFDIPWSVLDSDEYARLYPMIVLDDTNTYVDSYKSSFITIDKMQFYLSF